MKTQNDLEIYRYFDDIDEPAPDEAFVGNITNRIVKLKRIKRIKQGLVAFAVFVLAAVLFPWIVETTFILTHGSTYLANVIVSLAMSPIVWVIISALLFPFLLLLRYYSSKMIYRTFEFSDYYL